MSYDRLRRRGDTYAEVFVLTNATTGLPINITSHTFKLTVNAEKKPVDAVNQVFQLIGTILDAPNGKVEFAPNGTQAANVGTFYYDLEMTDAAGRVRTVIAGYKWKVEQDITKT